VLFTLAVTVAKMMGGMVAPNRKYGATAAAQP
jgi:hypothetical protein